MGKRYEQHSDLCGCSRCALEAESDNPRPVFDIVEDDTIDDELDGDYDDDYDDPEED